MKVAAEFKLGMGADGRLGNCPHLARIGHAGGVAQRDAGNRLLRKAMNPVHQLVGVDVAFHRATKHTGQRHIDRHVGGPGPRDDTAQLSEGLLAGHTQIGQVVRLAHRHHQIELIDHGFQRSLGAANIGHQRRIDDIRVAANLLHHRFGIAQHRNGFGRCERGHLNALIASRAQAIEQGDLVFGGNELALHPKAVAGRDLIDGDRFGLACVGLGG